MISDSTSSNKAPPTYQQSQSYSQTYQTIPTTSTTFIPISSSNSPNAGSNFEPTTNIYKHEDKRFLKPRNNTSTAFYLKLLVKLSFLAIIIFILASVFTNIYQAIVGSCRDLDKKVARLHRQNEMLNETIEALKNVQVELQNEVMEFSAENNRLKSLNMNLTVVRDELSNSANELQGVNANLQVVLTTLNVTFTDFEEEVDALLTDLTSMSRAYESELNDLTQVGIDLNLTIMKYHEEEELLDVLKSYQVLATNEFNIINKRDDLLQLVMPNEFRDTRVFFTEREYDEALEKVTVVFFPSLNTQQRDILVQKGKDEFTYSDNFPVNTVITAAKFVSNLDSSDAE